MNSDNKQLIDELTNVEDQIIQTRILLHNLNETKKQLQIKLRPTCEHVYVTTLGTLRPCKYCGFSDDMDLYEG